jgi:hypothetical protein
MINKKYYLPPGGDFPQGLPDYWRFDNGVVREDLKYLTTDKLNELGWLGPYTYPVPKNPNDATQPFNYDPETQKYIWDKVELKFHIMNMDENELEYLRALRTPPPPEPSAIPEPNWELFEKVVLRSTPIITLLTTAAQANPLVASAFPASFYMTKLGDFGSFRLIWKELMRYVDVYPQLVEDTVGLATGCHLPQEFIDIITVYQPEPETL